MRTTASMLLVLLFLACNKQSAPVPDESLQGRWAMTDSYIGTGNAEKVEHQKVSGTYFTYTPDSVHQLFYDVLNSARINDLTDSTYLTEGNNLPFRYKISGNEMELKHACDEGCRWIFKKAE